MGFAKLLIGWALSMAIYAALIQGWYVASGKPNGSFFESLLGIGVLLAIPRFLFALIVGWPTISWLASQQPAWLMPLAAAILLALIMWVIASLNDPIADVSLVPHVAV